MKKLYTLFAITIILIQSGCDPYPQDDYQEFIVVESYLIANNNLSKVRLSNTQPADAFYSLTQSSVNNASVQIELLQGGEGSPVEEVFPYDLEQGGVYRPIVSHDVLPSRTYRLNIFIPDRSENIVAHTLVPGNFEILGGIPDSIVYQSTQQLEINVTRSFYPDRQSIYIFNTLAADPDRNNLTPLYRDFYEDEEDLLLFANTSSGLINEGNFEVNTDNTITVQYPWLAAAFYGLNTIVVNAVDDNIYDFVRSSDVQLGGSTLSPGEIQNVIYNIEGAIGVFGSMTADSVQTYFQRQ